MIFTFWSVTNIVLSPTLLAQVHYTDQIRSKSQKVLFIEKRQSPQIIAFLRDTGMGWPLHKLYQNVHYCHYSKTALSTLRR